MILYREWVLPSAANLALPALLFPSVVAVMLPIDSGLAIPIAALCTLALAGVLVTSSPRVEVSETALTAKGAKVARIHLGKATVIPKNEVFEQMGSKLDARAWLAVQASVKGLVKVTLLDPKDPTPYWLISTRRPEKLVKLLNGN